MANSASFTRGSRFEWKVEDALLLYGQESDEFVACRSRWRLHLTVSSSKHMSVSLSKLNSEKLTGRYKIRCFAEDALQRPVYAEEHVLDDPDFTSKQIWWLSGSNVQNGRDLYVRHGMLTFVIAFMPIGPPATDATGEEDKSTQTSDSETTWAYLENLSLDFRRLLGDGTESDVTLKCGERSFPAHKLILSARSEIFAAMFRSDMSESRTGVVQISDMEASVLDQFLHYIYSGKLSDLSIDNAVALCMAADKYRTEILKNACLKFIEKNLTRENACKMLVFADGNGFKDLKDCVMRFIMNIELPRQKEIWLEFQKEHLELANEVLQRAYEEKCLSKRPRYN